MSPLQGLSQQQQVGLSELAQARANTSISKDLAHSDPTMEKFSTAVVTQLPQLTNSLRAVVSSDKAPSPASAASSNTGVVPVSTSKVTSFAAALTQSVTDTFSHSAEDLHDKMSNPTKTKQELMDHFQDFQKMDSVFSQISTLDHIATHLTANGKSVFDKLDSTAKQHLQSLYQAGALTKGDPASEAFLERLGSTIAGSKHDAQFTSQLMSDLAKGDVQMAMLVQHFPVTLSVTSTGSSQLNPVVIAIGKQAEAAGLKPKGHTEATVTLNSLGKELAKAFTVPGGVNSLSGMQFDASTVKGLMSHPTIDHQTCDILFGQALMLQHQLSTMENPSGAHPSADSVLKDAGISYSSKELTQMSSMGLKGTSQLSSLCTTIQKMTDKIAKRTSISHELTQTLTTKLDLVADRYKQRVSTKLMGVTSGTTAQRDVFAQGLGSKVDFSTGEQKRTKLFGKTILSGSMRTSIAGLFGKQKTLFDVCKKLNAHDSALTSLQTRLQMATGPEQKAKVMAEFSSTLTKASESQKAVSKSLQPVKAVIRLAMMDALASKDWSAQSVEDLQSGKLHTDIMARLDHYGLGDAEIKAAGGSQKSDLKALVQLECVHFKGVDSVKAWSDKLGLTTDQEQGIRTSENASTKLFLQGHTAEATSTSKEVDSWLDGMSTQGKLMIDLSTTRTYAPPSGTALAQEAFLMGTSIETSATATKGRQVLIEKKGDQFSVTLSKQQAVSLGITYSMLGGLLSLSHEGTAETARGVELNFSSKASAGLFITGLLTQNLDTGLKASLGSTLADVHEVAFVDHKKLSMTNSLTLGASLDSHLPASSLVEALGEITDTSLNLSITLSQTKSTQWDHKVNQMGETFTKTAVNSVSLEGLKTENLVPQLHSQKTSSVTLSQGVLTRSTLEQHYHLSSTTRVYTSLYKAALPSDVKAALSGNSTANTQFDAALKEMKPDQTIRVSWELPPKTCFEITQYQDPSSPSYDPAKAKAMLSDKSLYKPVSIDILGTVESTASAASQKGKESSAVESVQQNTILQMRVVAQIALN